MIPYERYERLLALLKKHNYLSTRLAAKELFVSISTVRRDFKYLIDNKLVRKWGSGIVLIKNPDEPPYPFSFQQSVEKKEKIASQAIKYIKGDQTIFLDSSSTVYFMVRKMENYHDIKVLTNGLASLNYLCSNTNAELFYPGGKVNRTLKNVSGGTVRQYISNFHADIVFMSCRGLSINGAFDATDEESLLKRTLSQHADQTVLLVDSDKFSKNFFHLSLSMEMIDVIISDRQLPEDIFEMAKKNNIKSIYPIKKGK
ncbi:DeoR/GlpR family DNA-binding transcription regulator [Sporolactobacillus sp. KGMB 08714]|uniref:DeoR/GlpR family DNA-binding transcription regulator n=1 Tax=Sporolactobacillus sp. KGMB 08714 TaxID=3064704 RepID=UPI002FBDD75E